jgi:3-hydroxyacyl-[acyl-carrier-protein] dehydratase
VKPENVTPLRLGADVVQMLLPHRRPFLLVDAVDQIELGARPTLWARKLVSANEPIFEGHFPGLSLWPGAYTIEGLGQTSNLLLILVAVVEAFGRHDRTPAQALETLRALEARHRLGTRPQTIEESTLSEALGSGRSRVGVAGAIDIKLVEPVFAGAVLTYRATQTHVLANARRFDVEAQVDGRPVARGSVTNAMP